MADASNRLSFLKTKNNIWTFTPYGCFETPLKFTTLDLSEFNFKLAYKIFGLPLLYIGENRATGQAASASGARQ